MNVAALLLVMTLAVAPQQETAGGTARALDVGDLVAVDQVDPTPPIDFDAAMRVAVAEVVLDRSLTLAEQEVVAEEERGFFGLMMDGTQHGGEWAFFGASALEMWSAYELRTQCEDSGFSCSDPFPGTTQQDILITGAVYAGAKGVQRLAKKYWDVDLDEGWKDLLIFGGMAGARMLLTARNVADANAIREIR